MKNLAATIEKRLLSAAMHALRSYQHGNASPDLAEDIANKIQEYLNDEN